MNAFFSQDSMGADNFHTILNNISFKNISYCDKLAFLKYRSAGMQLFAEDVEEIKEEVKLIENGESDIESQGKLEELK